MVCLPTDPKRYWDVSRNKKFNFLVSLWPNKTQTNQLSIWSSSEAWFYVYISSHEWYYSYGLTRNMLIRLLGYLGWSASVCNNCSHMTETGFITMCIVLNDLKMDYIFDRLPVFNLWNFRCNGMLKIPCLQRYAMHTISDTDSFIYFTG